MGAGHPQIFVVEALGSGLKRLTASKDSAGSPAWNRKTNAQIAWVGRQNGVSQIYIMDADGSHLQQITSEGYATSPSWAPNGLTLAFAWTRPDSTGAPRGSDIYIIDIASRQSVPLTRDAGRNDCPSWSRDGRHIVFQSDRSGSEQIWSMLADGTHQQRLTREGKNSQPNWSYK